jgi:hypothetical protein
MRDKPSCTASKDPQQGENVSLLANVVAAFHGYSWRRNCTRELGVGAHNSVFPASVVILDCGPMVGDDGCCQKPW